MVWPLRRVDAKTPYTQLKPGDWFERTLIDPLDISPEFRATIRTTAIFIRLPGNCGLWSPDQCASDSDSGWTLTFDGDDHPCTAHPSVNAGGCYHGFLHGGVLTDDMEGRKFS